MGPKRGADDDADTAAKRPKTQPSSRPARRAATGAVDQTYGQRGVFGTLDHATTAPGDSDLECEDDADALAYLRTVRMQASAIPHVLVAQKAGPLPPPQAAGGPGTEASSADLPDATDDTSPQDDADDLQGYYHDGAYTAYPDPGDSHEGEYEDGYGDDEESRENFDGRPRNSNSDEIRDAYFASITNRYMALRQRLRTTPPQNVLDALDESHPWRIQKPTNSEPVFPILSAYIRKTDPLPAQIAGMHRDGVFRLLRVILDAVYFRKGRQLHERTSTWIWALLARLPEKGELDYQEIGLVRDLGKRAVLFMLSLAELEVLQQQYDTGEVVGSEGGAEQSIEGGSGGFSPEPWREKDADAEEPEPGPSHPASTTPPPRRRNSSSPCSPKEGRDAAQGPEEAVSPTHRARIARDVPPGATPSSKLVEQKLDIAQPPSLGELLGDSSDVDMQLDSDMDDGEVADTPKRKTERATDIELAKARLLSQLDGTQGEGASASETALEASSNAADADLERRQVNMRATLNMILTVAGEFYGQRDLLEFRDPFGGTM